MDGLAGLIHRGQRDHGTCPLFVTTHMAGGVHVSLPQIWPGSIAKRDAA